VAVPNGKILLHVIQTGNIMKTTPEVSCRPTSFGQGPRRTREAALHVNSGKKDRNSHLNAVCIADCSSFVQRRPATVVELCVDVRIPLSLKS
jgi:hypothetical protein